MKNTAYISGSIFGFVAVALGAFGAHGLESLLTANGRIETWQTAVHYQFVHTGLLLILGLLIQNRAHKLLNIATVLTIVGILIFSGSLYILSLTNILWLGAITPLGGASFLGAWACLFIYFIKNRTTQP